MSVRILRAVSGAGKSTFATTLVTIAKDSGAVAHVVSTDDYFMVDGEYKFNPRLLGVAHTATQRKFLELVKDEAAVIIVDNTNTALWEFSWYVVTGELFGHQVEIITLLADPAVAHARNTHGVPAATVFRMDRQLREDTGKIPPHWTSTVMFV